MLRIGSKTSKMERISGRGSLKKLFLGLLSVPSVASICQSGYNGQPITSLHPPMERDANFSFPSEPLKTAQNPRTVSERKFAFSKHVML